MTTTEADRMPVWAQWKSLLGALAFTALLFGAALALSPAPADAMIRQESPKERCDTAHGWWVAGFGCVMLDGGSDGDGSGGGGSGGGSDDGGSGGGGGFGSGGDNPGGTDGSWGESPWDDDLKDPLNPECFELQTGNGVYEVCPTGPSDIIIDETGDDSVWDPEADRPRGPTLAMGGKRQGAPGRAGARKAQRKHRARAAANRR